jgi:hypothetical protein
MPPPQLPGPVAPLLGVREVGQGSGRGLWITGLLEQLGGPLMGGDGFVVSPSLLQGYAEVVQRGAFVVRVIAFAEDAGGSWCAAIASPNWRLNIKAVPRLFSAAPSL